MRRKVEIRVASKDRQARRPFFLEAANSSTLLRTTCTVPVAAASSRRSQLLLLLFIFIRALLARDPQAPRQDGRAGARSDPLRERHGAHVQDPKSTPAPSLLAWPGLAWPGPDRLLSREDTPSLAQRPRADIKAATSITKPSWTSRRPLCCTDGSAPASPCSSSSCASFLLRDGISVRLPIPSPGAAMS